MRPDLEVADIFRRHGPAYRRDRQGSLGRVETRVMRAVELCRTAELGGHLEVCGDCSHTRIAYNSRRNRHCPKCQGPAREAWLDERQKDLLPSPHPRCGRSESRFLEDRSGSTKPIGSRAGGFVQSGFNEVAHGASHHKHSRATSQNPPDFFKAVFWRQLWAFWTV